jgi:hypothetical protein
MSIRCDDESGTCVVAVTGDLSGDATTSARSVVERVLERSPPVDVVFDLGRLRWC